MKEIDVNNPEDRLKVYLDIERFLNLKGNYIYGMCAVMKVYGYKIKIDDLPELINQKPKNTFVFDYWFNPYMKEPRIEAIKKAIKEVKKLIKNNKS